MKAYQQVFDGDSIEVDRAGGINICCCDCGLVHHIDVEVKRGKIIMLFYRNNRKTAAIRRWHNKKEKTKDE